MNQRPDRLKSKINQGNDDPNQIKNILMRQPKGSTFFF